MNEPHVTGELVRKILGWQVHPNRYVTSGRHWIPAWRFDPFLRIDDAFHLLDRANAVYKLASDSKGTFTAEVLVGESSGKASGSVKAKTISIALARALGLTA